VHAVSDNAETRLGVPRAQWQEKTKEELFGMAGRELPTVRYTHVHTHRLMVRREMRWSPLGILCHMHEQTS
jgi:hypothetical protein